MYQIDYNSYRSVKGFNRRVRFLVMHYTACNFAWAVKLLADGDNVSAHYLIPDPTEETYIDAGFKDMRIFNLVHEYERAWHAGASYWAGRTDLNDTSIGIENVNLSSESEGILTFQPYNPIQVHAIKELSLNVLQRYPDITPTNVVAHSDISPGRKYDPGAKFPWKELYDAGIGAWYADETKKKYERLFFQYGLPPTEEIIIKLKTYGYDINTASNETGLKNLIMAFQLHFRPADYSGKFDVETVAILYALVEKYFSNEAKSCNYVVT
jgi:N-acetylmuramoyl-L-alanine amidase